MGEIIIVDDHPIVRETTAAYIEMVSGIVPVSFESSERALEYCRANEGSKLVFLDNRLAGKSGIEAIPEFRAIFTQQESRSLVAMLSNAPVSDLALEAGADTYIEKGDTQAIREYIQYYNRLISSA